MLRRTNAFSMSPGSTRNEHKLKMNIRGLRWGTSRDRFLGWLLIYWDKELQSSGTPLSKFSVFGSKCLDCIWLAYREVVQRDRFSAIGRRGTFTNLYRSINGCPDWVSVKWDSSVTLFTRSESPFSVVHVERVLELKCWKLMTEFQLLIVTVGFWQSGCIAWFRSCRILCTNSAAVAQQSWFLQIKKSWTKPHNSAQKLNRPP